MYKWMGHLQLLRLHSWILGEYYCFRELWGDELGFFEELLL